MFVRVHSMMHAFIFYRLLDRVLVIPCIVAHILLVHAGFDVSLLAASTALEIPKHHVIRSKWPIN